MLSFFRDDVRKVAPANRAKLASASNPSTSPTTPKVAATTVPIVSSSHTSLHPSPRKRKSNEFVDRTESFSSPKSIVNQPATTTTTTTVTNKKRKLVNGGGGKNNLAAMSSPASSYTSSSSSSTLSTSASSHSVTTALTTTTTTPTKIMTASIKKNDKNKTLSYTIKEQPCVKDESKTTKDKNIILYEKEQKERNKRRKIVDFYVAQKSILHQCCSACDESSSFPHCIESMVIVENERSAFKPYFEDVHTPESMPYITLEYPGKRGVEKYPLMHPVIKDGFQYHPIEDLRYSIQATLEYFLTPQQALDIFGYRFPPNLVSTPLSRLTHQPNENPPPSILRALQKSINRKDYSAFLSTIERFNDSMCKLKEDGCLDENIRKMDGVIPPLWMRITNQAYERTIGPVVESLRKYEAFSDNVYGELTPLLMDLIIRDTNLGPNSVFVDLGCGAGNCIVQASLATGCTSYGIESMANAAKLASQQVEEVHVRSCHLWGIQPGHMECFEGDFLNSPRIDKAISCADVVLVNNYAFSPSTNEALCYKFLDLKDGTLVVSLRAFVTADFKINARTAGRPEAILRVQSRSYRPGGVSWTGDGGTFYIHTVDRSRLEKFLG